MNAMKKSSVTVRNISLNYFKHMEEQKFSNYRI